MKHLTRIALVCLFLLASCGKEDDQKTEETKVNQSGFGDAACLIINPAVSSEEVVACLDIHFTAQEARKEQFKNACSSGGVAAVWKESSFCPSKNKMGGCIMKNASTQESSTEWLYSPYATTDYVNSRKAKCASGGGQWVNP